MKSHCVPLQINKAWNITFLYLPTQYFWEIFQIYSESLSGKYYPLIWCHVFQAPSNICHTSKILKSILSLFSCIYKNKHTFSRSKALFINLTVQNQILRCLTCLLSSRRPPVVLRNMTLRGFMALDISPVTSHTSRLISWPELLSPMLLTTGRCPDANVHLRGSALTWETFPRNPRLEKRREQITFCSALDIEKCYLQPFNFYFTSTRVPWNISAWIHHIRSVAGCISVLGVCSV